jgi:hypothetical protein
MQQLRPLDATKQLAVEIDHVFICCDPGGPEADSLFGIGLVEGSGNVHPGQGTTNRRFFFHGGFLELLWVHDAEEARSPLTAPTKLWDRWATRKQGNCPFGIAFRPAGETVTDPPFTSWAYRPNYLPPDKPILFAQHTTLLEPELFYLAWAYPQKSAVMQPKNHPNGLAQLLSVSVGLPAQTPRSASSTSAQAAGVLRFHTADRYELRLLFSGKVPVVFDLSPSLPLVLTAAPNAA